MTQDRQTCPTCQTDTVVPVVYGFPIDDTFEAAGRGEVVLGGCVIDDVPWDSVTLLMQRPDFPVLGGCVIDDVPWEHRGQQEMRCTSCGKTTWVGRARHGSRGGTTEDPA